MNVRDSARKQVTLGSAASKQRILGRGDAPTVPVPEGLARDQPLAATAKRLIDVIGGALLIVFLMPLLLVIAALVKVDSPGPVLFRQRRVGRNGEIFPMLKFRTMIPSAELDKLAILHLNEAGDGLFKIRKDPRVTRFGRWLRTTSLDELPQLLHVVSGRMSLVGPRPLIPEEDALIGGSYRRRLQIRPGMTGSWQVAGASRIPLNEMVELDIDYMANWSLIGDLMLLLGTGRHVLLRRGL